MNRGSQSATWQRPLGSGFNEAPIHESGKSDCPRPRVRRIRASMRPRFMNRGSRRLLPIIGFG